MKWKTNTSWCLINKDFPGGAIKPLVWLWKPGEQLSVMAFIQPVLNICKIFWILPWNEAEFVPGTGNSDSPLSILVLSLACFNAFHSWLTLFETRHTKIQRVKVCEQQQLNIGVLPPSSAPKPPSHEPQWRQSIDSQGRPKWDLLLCVLIRTGGVLPRDGEMCKYTKLAQVRP